MAGKMEPEDAFRLLGKRGEGVKTRKHRKNEGESFTEDQMDGSPRESPKWLRYTIISIITIFALSFIGLLTRGAFLLIDKKEQVTEEMSEKEPLVIYSEDEIEELITARLEAFLSCTTTQQRAEHVLSPKVEEEAMRDYYETRGNLDSALWKIELIKSATLAGGQLWMVAYLDVNKVLHYMRFERSGNAFLIQWSSSYGYGQLPWNTFASTQPSKPVQMRCFILRHTGTFPPGIDPTTHMIFVIENKRGEFTSTAIMNRDAEGFRRLVKLPNGARTPVNLSLKYTDSPTGTRQLTIDQLIHFQWHQSSISNKGMPVQLRE